jgi:Domain of Unknown Function with PDB structure (DUF3857)/Transglutaminase-like superfamily
MTSKSFSSPEERRQAIEALMKPVTRLLVFLCMMLLSASVVPQAHANDQAPDWMHAVVNAPLPPHDEKTNAVLLYSEDVTVVQPVGKFKYIARRVYKILRPEGRRFGTVYAYFDSNLKITSMRAWCIPQQGKDYVVKEKDATEIALAGVEYSDLITDARDKRLRIPAADPGNVIGWEIDSEVRPYILQDWWFFQQEVPVGEARYVLQLPPGWEYKAAWVNHPEIQPVSQGSNEWQWVVKNVPGIRWERDMPPPGSLSGYALVNLFSPSGAPTGRSMTWNDIGRWQAGLASGRREASPEIKQKVAELTASLTTPLAKMQALAAYVQQNIRYVAIEMGIGGWQPHPAPEIFTHLYGDCKDKATLMSTMLKLIGIDSYYIFINTARGGVNAQTAPTPFAFDHAIIAIRLPDGVNDPSLQVVIQDPKLGRLLIFDPTDDLTPFGHLRGELQANYALLVTPDGGELFETPQLSPETNGISRSAKMSLDASGNLQGNVLEIGRGNYAAYEREALRSATKDADKIKPIETLLSHSLADFHLTKASVTNLDQISLPFSYQYSLIAPDYAKNVGNLLLVRPRLIGTKSSDLLETKDPRKYPIEFDGPEQDTDHFEITLPPGYVVDDLPPPTDVDYSFASYHSKTQVVGNALVYTRTFVIKELNVPLSKVDDLKKLYRIIASDERNTAVLRRGAN